MLLLQHYPTNRWSILLRNASSRSRCLATRDLRHYSTLTLSGGRGFELVAHPRVLSVAGSHAWPPEVADECANEGQGIPRAGARKLLIRGTSMDRKTAY